MKRVLLISILPVMVISIASAEIITIFDSNATIGPGDAYDTVVVKGDGTVVTMTGGDVNDLTVMDSSTVNKQGGDIHWYLRSYDESVINFSGGSVNRIMSYSQSQINISGDANMPGYSYFHHFTHLTVSGQDVTIAGQVDLYGESAMNVLAGSLSSIKCLDSCTVNVSGGTISSVYCPGRAYLNSNSKVYITGGEIDRLDIQGFATVRLSGGAIDRLDTRLWSNWWFPEMEVSVIGYDLEAVPYGGSYGSGQLTGHWNNHVSFSVNFISDSTYPHVTLYDGVIPPDCVTKPESDNSGDCKVNFTDLGKLSSEWLDCGLEPNEVCWE